MSEISSPSELTFPKPASTTFFSPLIALVAKSPETDLPPPGTRIPGIVLIQRSKSSFIRAYTTKLGPTAYFSVTDISPDLMHLLREAPIFPRLGDQKRFKAGIYLDDLPDDIPRPKLTLVKAAEADFAAPVAATSATAPATRGRKPGRKAKGAVAATTKVMKEKAPAALAPAGAPAPTAPAAATAPTVRPKELEIDMVPGTFVAVGGRSNRPKKRPARFDDGAEVVEVKKRKGGANA
ncbi:MAG: hypothetical protein Q9225_001976 [Loekoesia sp. 1 TL-2023]